MNEYKVRFLKLIKNPLLPISSTYPYVLGVLVIIGYYYMKNSGTVFQTTLEPSLIEKQLPQELEIQEPKVLAAVTPEMIRTGSPEMIDKGKQSFQTVCSSCHGAEGKGDGVAGTALNPKPRNFSAEDGWKNGRKITDLYRTIQKGLIQTGMPGYDYMPVDERLGIIHYITKNFMTNLPTTTEEDFAALDAEFNLSKGVEQPGQIPIASAFILLEKSNDSLNQKLASIQNKIDSERTTVSSAQLFCDVALNINSATSLLLRNESWKNSPNDFLNTIQNNIINNGFSSKVYKISEGELTSLFNYLKTLYL